jgi:hypothetical protein
MEAVHACEELMQRAEEHSAKEVLGPWDSGRHGTERSRKIKKDQETEQRSKWTFDIY